MVRINPARILSWNPMSDKSTDSESIVRTENLSKRFRSGEIDVLAVDSVTISIAPARSVAIVGPSGSGKSTLLALCAGLDRPSGGSVTLSGTEISKSSEEEVSRLRNRIAGFVFQNFRLLPSLTALENVMVPAEIQGRDGARKDALSWLERVGLSHRLHHFPAELSGGEQQRVALARAFVNCPQIVFADEPTGNLDRESAERVRDLLFRLNSEQGTTLVIATHDAVLADRADSRVSMSAGKLLPT